MIRVDQKREIILLYFREGKSQREISRIMGINRKTISKYINQYKEALDKLEKLDKLQVHDYDINNNNIIKEEAVDTMVGKPKYNTLNRKPRKITEELKLRVEEFIKENDLKRKIGLRKQVMPVTQMYEIIRDEGYSIGMRTIYRLVKQITSNTIKESYIKQIYSPGDIVEFDWGEVKLKIGDIPTSDSILSLQSIQNIKSIQNIAFNSQMNTTLKSETKLEKYHKYQMAVFTFAYSNYRYALLYERQNMESFIDAHVRFFEHINGVNKTIVYDNMKVAIRKFVGRNERELTDDFMKLSMYYRFNVRFCNVRKPNEKGHVEKSVDVLHKRVFSIKDKFNNLDEARAFLSMRVKYLNNNMVNRNRVDKDNNKNLTPKDIFENEEKECLAYKPLKYEFLIIKKLFVDKYSTISLFNCRYSVPVKYTNKWLKVKISPEKIVIYDKKPIATHERVYGQNIWKMNIQHYIPILKKKPGALHGSLALHQASEKIKNIYQRYFTTYPKEFITLIEYMHKNSVPIKDIEKAIKYLEIMSPKDISFAKIRIIYESRIMDKNEINESNKNAITINGNATTINENGINKNEMDENGVNKNNGVNENGIVANETKITSIPSYNGEIERYSRKQLKQINEMMSL